eukprot:1178260-Prorocentrum_minimum.AAC.1
MEMYQLSVQHEQVTNRRGARSIFQECSRRGSQSQERAKNKKKNKHAQVLNKIVVRIKEPMKYCLRADASPLVTGVKVGDTGVKVDGGGVKVEQVRS